MSLGLGEACAVFAAGLGAGAVNSIAGAGSLITFPTLIAVGYGSVVANVSNTIGLVPGSIAGAVGYRRELAGQAARVRTLLPFACIGAVVGGVLLLVLPQGVFRSIVPVLILFGAALVLAQPRVRAAMATRPARRAPVHVGIGTCLAIFATAVYGGYFGAAQGVLLIGILGIGLPLGLHAINGMKNVLAGAVNAVAAAYFAIAADVAWEPAGLLAVGSIIGGALGVRYGRRIPPAVLRWVIAVVGLGVAIALLIE